MPLCCRHMSYFRIGLIGFGFQKALTAITVYFTLTQEGINM